MIGVKTGVTHVEASKVKAHTHHTAHHGSAVRTEHEFFGALCDELADIAEVLVVGPKTGIDAFRHYADKHRPHTASHIVGDEVVDHPTQNPLMASARKWFLRYDRMNGTPTPT